MTGDQNTTEDKQEQPALVLTPEDFTVPTEELTGDEYEAILPEYKKYHTLGPKDCKWGAPEELCFNVQIQRQTSTTGEQIAIQVPVYTGDSRQEMLDKIYLGYAIIQERLEDENRVMQGFNERMRARKAADAARAISKEQQRKLIEQERQRAKHLAKAEKKGLLKVQSNPGVTQ